jgi:CBS domain-containing protein
VKAPELDADMASDIKTLLTGTPISSILPNRPLVYLSSSASISDVLELLSKHSILSAPVFAAGADNGAAQPSIGTLLGFVDVWAVLVAFLQSLPGERGTLPASSAGPGCRSTAAAASLPAGA